MWTIYYLENKVIENNRSLVGKTGEGFENNSSREEETGEIEEEAACVMFKGLAKTTYMLRLSGKMRKD